MYKYLCMYKYIQYLYVYIIFSTWYLISLIAIFYSYSWACRSNQNSFLVLDTCFQHASVGLLFWKRHSGLSAFTTPRVPSTSLHFIAIFGAAVDRRLLPPTSCDAMLAYASSTLCPPSLYCRVVHTLGNDQKRRPVKPSRWLIVISSYNPLVLAAHVFFFFCLPESRQTVFSALHHCVYLRAGTRCSFATCESQVRGKRPVWRTLFSSRTQVFSLWRRRGMELRHLKSTRSLTRVKTRSRWWSVRDAALWSYLLSQAQRVINTTSIHLVRKGLWEPSASYLLASLHHQF